MSVTGVIRDPVALGAAVQPGTAARVRTDSATAGAIDRSGRTDIYWHNNPPWTVADHKNCLGKLGSDPVA